MFYPLTNPTLKDLPTPNCFLVSATGAQPTVTLALPPGVDMAGTLQVDAGTATVFQVRIYGRIDPRFGWRTLFDPTANTSGFWTIQLTNQVYVDVLSTNGTLQVGVSV